MDYIPTYGDRPNDAPNAAKCTYSARPAPLLRPFHSHGRCRFPSAVQGHPPSQFATAARLLLVSHICCRECPSILLKRALRSPKPSCWAHGVQCLRHSHVSPLGCPERLQGYVLLPSAIFSILPRPFISISIDLKLTCGHRVDRTRRRLRSRLRQVRLFPQHCSPGVSR